MYTDCAFERVGRTESEIYQTTFAEHMLTQYGIITVFNIPDSPGVDLGPNVEGETGGNEEFEDYHAFVENLMWVLVMTRPDIANALRARARHRHNPTARHWKTLLHIAA